MCGMIGLGQQQVMITTEMTTQKDGGWCLLSKGTADGPNGEVGPVAPFYFYTGALFWGSQSRQWGCCRGRFKSPGVKSKQIIACQWHPLTVSIRQPLQLYNQLLLFNFVQYTPQHFYSHTEHDLDGLVPLVRLVLIAPYFMLPSQTETSLLHLKHLPRNVEYIRTHASSHPTHIVGLLKTGHASALSLSNIRK